MSKKIAHKICHIHNCKRIEKALKTILPYSEKQDTFAEQLNLIGNEEYIINSYRIVRLLRIYDVNITFNVFNTILLIYTFSETILMKDIDGSEQKESYRLKIIKSVDRCIEEFKKFDHKDKLSILKLSNRLKTYLKYFNDWKNIDKICVVENFASMYYKFDEIIQFIKKDKTESELYLDELEKIEHLTKSKNNILDKIKQIGGYDIFKDIKPKVFDHNDLLLEKELKESVEESYWELLRGDLMQVPIDFKHLTDLLKQIKNIVIEIFHKEDKIIQDLKLKTKDLDKNCLDFYGVIQCTTFYFEMLIEIFLDENCKLKFKDGFDKDKKICDLKKTYKEFKTGLIEGQEVHTFIPNSTRILVKTFYEIYGSKEKVSKLDIMSKIKFV